MLFLLVGVIYDRAHTREIDRFGGLAGADAALRRALRLRLHGVARPARPVAASSASCWCSSARSRRYRVVTVVAATGVIITAAYHLWALQRVQLGRWNEAWHDRSPFRDLTARETRDAGAARRHRARARLLAAADAVARRPRPRRSVATRAALMLDNAHSLAAFAPELALAGTLCVVLLVDLIVGRLRIGWVAALTIAGVAVAAWLTLATGHAPPHGLFFGLIARDPFGDFWKLLVPGDGGADGVGLAARRRRHRRERRRVLRARHGDHDRHDADGVGRRSADRVPVARDGVDHELRARRLPAARAPIGGGGAQVRHLRRRRLGRDALRHVAALRSWRQRPASRRSCRRPRPRRRRRRCCSRSCCVSPGSATRLPRCRSTCGARTSTKARPRAVTAFFSVGPKAAGFALLLRFCTGVLPAELAGARAPWPLLFGLIAAATMTLGNLAALQQTNLKRLLAYSSIAQAGYVLSAVVAGGRDGARAILVYLVAYLFMNLGAFTVVIAVAERGIGDELAAWRGLGRRAPWAAAAMAIFLFSLTGLPPLSGFFAKFYVFYALVARGGTFMVALAVVGILNSARVALLLRARRQDDVLRAARRRGDRCRSIGCTRRCWRSSPRPPSPCSRSGRRCCASSTSRSRGGRFCRHEFHEVHDRPRADALRARSAREPRQGGRARRRSRETGRADRLPAGAVSLAVLLPEGRLGDLRSRRADPRAVDGAPRQGRARARASSSSRRCSSGAPPGSITTRRRSSTPTARCAGSIARCTSPTIRSTTRSTTSRRAISASARTTRSSDASARWCAGTSGIPRARG